MSIFKSDRVVFIVTGTFYVIDCSRNDGNLTICPKCRLPEKASLDRIHKRSSHSIDWVIIQHSTHLKTQFLKMAPKVFLITGTSTGFGKHLVQEVLDKGDICVATARKPDSLSFNNTTSKNYLAVKLDVTSHEDIESAFKATLDKFGRVDVVVNNAGYGLSGPFEELSPEQVRTQMEVNFFGLTEVTRKAMAVMREQKPSGGLIQQVTSIGGQRG